jgi:glyoxylase-like metal-dependent hydrolase (beta-lactamase superfamily II)
MKTFNALLLAAFLLQQPGAKVQAPTAFPPPGTYNNGLLVSLLCSTPGATIHYTVDGQLPDASSPVFEPYKLVPVQGESGMDAGLTARTIRAIAVNSGMANSDPVTLSYTIQRRDRKEYEAAEIHPGIWMISDYATDKMFLVKGSRKAVLIDTGQGSGNLKQFVLKYAGEVPLEIVLTHLHPDHIGQADQFISEHTEYVNDEDRPAVVSRLQKMGASEEVISKHLLNIKDGDTIDIGGRSLHIYQVPGHTRGGIAVLDDNGCVYAGDALGSNRPTVPDQLWMHLPTSLPVDRFLSALQVFRYKSRGRVREIYTGHNDAALEGEEYLNNLEKAAQQVVDLGSAALVPAVRPTTVWQSVVGDRAKDKFWAAIDLNKDNCLSAPIDQISTLSNIEIEGATLKEPFQPSTTNYLLAVRKGASSIRITPVATSTRSRGITVNGFAVKSRAGAAVQSTEKVVIVVTAPNGSSTTTYTLVPGQ